MVELRKTAGTARAPYNAASPLFLMPVAPLPNCCARRTVARPLDNSSMKAGWLTVAVATKRLKRNKPFFFSIHFQRVPEAKLTVAVATKRLKRNKSFFFSIHFQRVPETKHPAPSSARVARLSVYGLRIVRRFSPPFPSTIVVRARPA